MRKTLIALLIVGLALALAPANAFAAWTAVGGCAFAEGTTNGDGFTTTGASCNSTGASVIIVFISTFAPAGSATVTNSTGGTMVCGATFTDGVTVMGKICIFEAVTGASGNTITTTCTQCFPSVTVKAFSGSTGCALLDQTATTNSNFSTSIAANGITATVNNLLVIQALALTDAIGPITADSGFEMHETTILFSAGNYLGGAMSYKVINNGDTSPTTWNLGSGSSNATSAKSFLDTGTSCGGGATTPPFVFVAQNQERH